MDEWRRSLEITSLYIKKKLIITSALFRFTGDMVVTGPSGLYHCETSAGQEYEQKKETVDS